MILGMIVGHHSKLAFSRLWLNRNKRIVYLADKRDLGAPEQSFNISFFDKSVGSFKGEDGRNLTWQVESRVNAQVERLLRSLDIKAMRRFFPNCIDDEDIVLWFRRFLTLDLYAPVAYWEAVLRDPDYAGDRDFYDDSPIVRDYLKQAHGISAKGGFFLPVFKFAAILPWLAMKFLKRPLPKARYDGTRLAIAHFHGLGRAGGLSDLFWFERSGLAPEQVQFYDESGIDHGADIKAKGFGYTHSMIADLPLRDRMALAFRLTMLSLKAFITFRPFLSLKGWISYAGVIEYNRYFEIWLQFFKTYSIRLHIHHGDSNLSLVPHTHALEKACGGVDLTYDFSASGFVLPQLSRPVDQMQYIGWGAWCHRSLEMAGAKANTKRWHATFLSGYYKHFLRDKPLSPNMEAAVKTARESGKRIIGVFDLSCSPARLLPMSAKIRFYEIVAGLIEDSRNTLFLVKPQRPLEMPKDLQARFDAFQAKGKCHWAPGGIDATLLQPVFKQIDFAIGLGGFNSALIEGGSESVPHLFYDEWDCIAENMRETIPAQLFATDEAALRAMVASVDDGSFTTESILGWSAYLNRLDPFRDARGHERIGDIVRLWHEALAKQEMDSRERLDWVVGRYRDLHGKDSVLETAAAA